MEYLPYVVVYFAGMATLALGMIIGKGFRDTAEDFEQYYDHAPRKPVTGDWQ